MAKLLTPQELADQWQMHVKSIYHLVEQGKLRALRLPGSKLLRFDPDNLRFSQRELDERQTQREREARAIVARHDARRGQRTVKQIVMPPLPPRRPPE